MSNTFGAINFKSSSNDHELLVLCDTSGLGVVTRFLRKITTSATGVVTNTDTLLDGITPYVVTGTVGTCLDEEFYSDITNLCAIADSPVDYPNVGDPIGTAYQIGDKILIQYLIEAHNPLNPVISAYKNLSNGSFPQPFWLNLNGTDVLGSFPNPADFSACETAVCGGYELCDYVDDTLNDGTVLVPFKKLFKYNCELEIFEFSKNLEGDDLTAEYTPVGTEYKSCEYGSPMRLSQRRVVLNGAGSWTSAPNVTSYSIKVLQDNGGPTFTDTNSVVTALFAGESISFNSSGEALLVDGVIVTALAGDIVIIDYQELSV